MRASAVQSTDVERAAPDHTARSEARLPFVTYVLALGTFLMATSEFIVAGILPEIAGDLGVGVARSGLLITIFAVGMIIGAPLMTMLTLRLPQRSVLVLALVAFAAGHLVVALSVDFTVLLAARFVSALATGAFWAVSNVVGARAAGPALSARAMGIIGAGAMLANVVGVPLGAFAGQLLGWRGPFWALTALAIAAVAMIVRFVSPDRPDPEAASMRAEFAALRSGRMWLVLAACVTTTGGVLSAYSYIAPLLTERTGLAAGLIPLVLVGFGLGALVGTVIGGRLGDTRPHLTTIAAPAASAVVLTAVSLFAGYSVVTVVLVTLLGAVGLGANPVLISLAVRYAGSGATLGSSLAVAAFNTGTAIGSAIAGLALGSTLGVTGPAVVGAVIAALTLVPVISLALHQRRPTWRITAHASA